MKKIMVLAIVMIAAMAFSMEISRNRLMVGAELDYVMPAEKTTIMGMTIPGILYEFEAKPNDMFKLYLNGMAGYTMTQESYDGEAVVDQWGSVMFLNLDPAAKVYLPNNLFGKIILPFDYYNIQPQYMLGMDFTTTPPTLVLDEEPDSYAVNSMDADLQFGYDTREIYIHGLTPWDRFEKGILGYAFYKMGLMYSVDGESPDDLPSYFGIYGAYAHYADAMMIKPYLSYEMQLNEDAAAKDAELNIGLDFVKDFTEQINLEAGLNYMMVMPEDSDIDGEADLTLEALVNYYVMPELDVFAGLEYWLDQTKDNESDPSITIKLGALYELNFIK